MGVRMVEVFTAVLGKLAEMTLSAAAEKIKEDRNPELSQSLRSLYEALQYCQECYVNFVRLRDEDSLRLWADAIMALLLEFQKLDRKHVLEVYDPETRRKVSDYLTDEWRSAYSREPALFTQWATVDLGRIAGPAIQQQLVTYHGELPPPEDLTPIDTQGYELAMTELKRFITSNISARDFQVGR